MSLAVGCQIDGPCYCFYGSTSSNTGFYTNALGSFLEGGDSKYWSAGDVVWGLCPQRGPGAEPLVRGSWGRSPLQKLAAFCGVSS